jgi:hypothetical protein
MQINLGSIQIPLNAATKTFAILAKRGAGKTYTGAVPAEEFHKNRIPFVVFDPIDVWWGLRLGKDGQSKGMPVVVFGAEHADIPLSREMGRNIAQAVVKENVSCVLSTFGMPKIAQRHLTAEFSEELLNINNTPRHVFIEEAHEFVPQHVGGALGKTFNAVSNLVVMGRNRGIGVTLINQRAATINKDVLTQLDTLLAFRNVSPQDRKALKEWVKHHAAEGDFEHFITSLPSLPTGEGWIWSPEFLGIFDRLKIRARETFHPDREKIGDAFVMPQLDQVDIQSFIANFQAMRPAEKKPAAVRVHEDTKPRRESQELIQLRNEYESRLLQKDREIRQRDDMIEQIRKIVGAPPNGTSLLQQSASVSNVHMWLDKLGNDGSARILKFLADKSGMKFTRPQVALAVGLSHRGGTFTRYIGLLKRNRLILEQQGQLWVNPEIRVPPAGGRFAE